MLRKSLLALGAVFGAAALLAAGAPAQADTSGVKAGILTCNVSSGWGFVFGSSRDLKCHYSPRSGVDYHYSGKISKFGVDIGYLSGGVIVWAVIAPTTEVAPGDLAGHYGGVTGGASVGVGASANVLIGGSSKTISLQPLSIEGNNGLNVAAGIAEITLRFQQ